MNKQITLATLLSTVLLLAAGAAQAAPSAKETGVVTLPRVVVNGKAVKQLPTVVVTGYSIEGQMRRQMLAQAATKPVRRG
ncbi:hypothetical protein SNE35_08195 [Paucibacter sp. R3-3]|uniref:Uncharacterized protein n=1 Tax=Roseateles agri TaxID=3098619 RepID=A0ABU5DFD4_9BURK|nr:hypothetical protein [Paucibacter sp. R3-3]MDY0744483.1 hypothetical protein [Paucibacter sp. R3-3]